MKIVICDDSIEDLSTIEALLIKYKQRHSQTNLEIIKFSDASLLYQRTQKQKLADIYLLDLMMSPNTGIEIGRQIRKTDDDASIIYITASDDFALEAYDVHAARYLLKPVDKKCLYEALDYVVSYKLAQKTDNEAVFLVKTKTGVTKIPYSQIEYIENCARTLEVHIITGEIIKSIFIRNSFDQEISALAHEKQFVQTHKSYVINFKYVQTLVKNQITMESKARIPVSQKRSAAVRKAYLSFIAEYYGQERL